MPSVIVRLRVRIAHPVRGGERFVAAFPGDRMRDLIARVLVESGIEDDPRGWELFDGVAVAPAERTVGDLLARNPPAGAVVLRQSTPVVRPTFTDLLLKKGVIGPEQLDETRRLADATGVRLHDMLVKLHYATPIDVTLALAGAHGTRFIDLHEIEIPRAIIELVPESVARENQVLPLSLEGNALTIIAADPTDADLVRKLQFILNKQIVLVVATLEQISDAIDRYYGETETESVDSMLMGFPDTAIEFTEWDEASSDREDAGPPSGSPAPRPPAAPAGAVAAPPVVAAAPRREARKEEADEEVPRKAKVRSRLAELKKGVKGLEDEEESRTARRATVRYYSRMNPERVFPLLVVLSREEVERVVKRHVAQAATGPIELAKDVPLEIEPVLPGCACYPPKVVTRLDAADQSFTFHVVPHVLGRVTGARVLVRQDNATLAEIELDVRVVQRTMVVLSGLSALLLPTASAVMNHFGIDFTPKDGANPYLAAMKFLFGQVTPAAMMAALAALTGVLYWVTRPKGRDVFWDISTKPPK